MKTLAISPTKEGLKESIARYWCTTPDLIDIYLTSVFQDCQQMYGYEVRPHRSGFKFVELKR